MARITVGILRGGTSSEYDLSLKTGAAMLAALPEDRFEMRDVFIDKKGYWHLRGIPVEPARALSQVDVVLSALHGGIGEDGTVQRLLHTLGVPYAGARALPANLALHKIRARDVLLEAGIRMPEAVSFSIQDDMNTAEMARAAFARFGPPYVVKPPSEGASTGIRIAHNINQLPDTVGDVIDAYGAALVEQYIRGHDATVGVVEQFRGQDFYALPPAHVIAPQGSHIIERAHYDDMLQYRVPSDFTDEQKNALIDTAIRAHQALGLSHFSRADFVVGVNGPYLLEVNATPKLHKGSALPHMLESVGSSVREFLEHLIHLAKTA